MGDIGLGANRDATGAGSGSGSGGVGVDGIDGRSVELARKCWDEEQGWIGRERMAEWLGGVGAINKAALKHYMDFFDFSALRLDQAFRRLCAKLYLKAETQQLDRILEQFSRRYWECNPSSIYGSAGVVHAIAYSLLLLNTDLHIAELSSHMSRREFVKNTMETVWAQLRPEQRESGTPVPGSFMPAPRASGGSVSMDIPRPMLPSPVEEDESLPPVKHHRDRSGSLTSWKNLQRSDTAPMLSSANGGAGAVQPVHGGHGTAASISVPVLRKSESEASVDAAAAVAASAGSTYGKGWEGDMESLLKDMFNAVKAQQILQPIANMSVSSTNLNSTPHSAARRVVRTPSNLKRGSIRGLHQLLSANGPTSPYSSAGGSTSSIDGRLSPAPSFATSETNFGSGSTLFTPPLGFASNLSHTIIKESLGEDLDGHRMHHGLSTAAGRRDLASRSTASLVSQSQESTEDGELSDEELALLGPPWAKEGMLCRKQYWESAGKRAKNKDWKDVFVVIQKGELGMFIFGEGPSVQAGADVGGGNWLNNASRVGGITLSHSLAHVLPPPGYNRQRPHCFVLTLSDGAVYFFQAGTEDLVNEWVTTSNYWAARLSKEPLQGGVSNMEYGWNRVLPHTSYGSDSRADTLSIKSSNMSLRIGNSPYTDRTLIADWKTPMAPSIPSVLDEESQLESLQKHVKTLQNDLDAHTKLKEPMLHMYAARSTSYAKALANWERKSQYLLSEVVKYTSYVESLRHAMSLRLKKQGEKSMERALNKGSTAVVELVSPSSVSVSSGSTAAAGSSGRKGSNAPVDTIQELPEPVTPAKSDFHGAGLGHKRESAETES